MKQLNKKPKPLDESTSRNISLFKRARFYMFNGFSEFEMAEAIRKDNLTFTKPVDDYELAGIINSAASYDNDDYSNDYYNDYSNYQKENKKEVDLKNIKTKKVYVEDYIYTSEYGNPVFKKTRYNIVNEETGEVLNKITPFFDMINHRNDLSQLNKSQKSLFYNLVGINKLVNETPDEPLYIVEGEKDANTLIKHGLTATCLKSPSERINNYHLTDLLGIKTIYILPDKDKAGYTHAFKLYEGIKDHIKDIHVLVWNEDLISEDPNSEKFAKWDITDQVEAEGYTSEELENFIKDNSIKSFPDKYLDEVDGRLYKGELRVLTQLLRFKGREWITDQEEKSKKGIPPRVIAKILDENCYFTLLGYKSDHAPLAVYDTETGVYTTSRRHINLLIQSVENVTINKQKEVYNQLTLSLYGQNKFKTEFSNSDYSIFNNGIYNHETRKLEPFTPRKLFLSKVSTNYVKDAKEPHYDDWSFSKYIEEQSEGNPEKIKQMWQFWAKIIRPNYNTKTAYFLYDNKSNTGKSTFQRLAMNIVGLENCSSLDLAQLEEKFSPATAEGKALIVGDDNDRNYDISKSNNFKRITSGEYMNVEKKGENGYQTKFNTTIVQSMNGLPKFKTVDKGLLSRIVILKFPYEYTIDKRNPKVKEVYIEDPELLEYIVSKAVDIDIKNTIITEENKTLSDQLARSSEPLKAFYEEVVVGRLLTEVLPVLYIYKMCKEWFKFEEGEELRMPQREFTTKFKEIMEDDGWVYKNMKLTERFDIEHCSSVWEDIRKNDTNFSSILTEDVQKGYIEFHDKYKNNIKIRKQERCFVQSGLTKELYDQEQKENEERSNKFFESLGATVNKDS